MDEELQRLGRAAVQLERAGRLEEAEAAYRQLLARWPALPDTWFNLGLLQRRLQRYDDALASYQQALDRGVAQPEEAHLNRGVIYADYLRREDAAAAELEKALRLNPRYVPALLNLANLREDLGDATAAAMLYERALAVDPACHTALARLAVVKTARGPDALVTSRLAAALAQPAVSAADRATLGFALASALEKAGRYDAAFAAATEANRQSRLSAGPAGVRYDREQIERDIDAIVAAFPAEAAAGRAGSATVSGGNEGPQPLFVCGMFRSGSTLVEQLLTGHADVASGGELDFMPALARGELAPFPQSMAGLDAARRREIVTRYQALLARLHPQARYVVDKRPDNFLYVGLIKTLFPAARVVHTTRDPLDNCLSVYFLHLDHSMSYALDLLDTGHYYRQCQRLMAHWREVYGDDIVEVSYDALVRDPRPVLERALGAAGLAWDERCLDFERRSHAVKTASVWQVRQPLYQHASGRARHYAAHVAALAAYLAQPSQR